MSPQRLGSLFAVACLAATLAAAPSSADEHEPPTESRAPEPAVSVTRTAQGLSLEARDASLREVLERLAAVEKIELDIRGTSDPRVTATIRDASLPETLQRLVRYDFVLGVGRLIVYLGDTGRGRTGATANEPAERFQHRSGGFRLPVRRPPPVPQQDEEQAEPEPEDD